MEGKALQRLIIQEIEIWPASQRGMLRNDMRKMPRRNEDKNGQTITGKAEKNYM